MLATVEKRKAPLPRLPDEKGAGDALPWGVAGNSARRPTRFLLRQKVGQKGGPYDGAPLRGVHAPPGTETGSVGNSLRSDSRRFFIRFSAWRRVQSARSADRHRRGRLFCPTFLAEQKSGSAAGTNTRLLPTAVSYATLHPPSWRRDVALLWLCARV